MKKTLLLLFFFFFIKSYTIPQIKSDSVNAEIRSQILILKQKNDSLSKRLDQIEKNDYKSIDVIEKVNDFYDKSWTKLIAFLSIAGSIILVVIPYIQIRNYDEKIDLKTKQFENLTNKKVLDLEVKISEFHKDQFEILRKEIGLSQVELNKNILNETQYLHALVFLLRGMIARTENQYDLYFKHYTIALETFIGLNKSIFVKDIIVALTKNIEKCNAKKIVINKNTKLRIQKVISTLEKEYGEIYPVIIKKLKLNFSKVIIE